MQGGGHYAGQWGYPARRLLSLIPACGAYISLKKGESLPTWLEKSATSGCTCTISPFLAFFLPGKKCQNWIDRLIEMMQINCIQFLPLKEKGPKMVYAYPAG